MEMHCANCWGAEKRLQYPHVQDLMRFNNTIIQFLLVGYEIGHSQHSDARLVGHLPSHIQRALMK